MAPHNSLDKVRRLASDERGCEVFGPVLDELGRRALDTDDLFAIIQTELGDTHFTESEPTRRHYPTTVSDYYSIWADDCSDWMFLKLLDGRRRRVPGRHVFQEGYRPMTLEACQACEGISVSERVEPFFVERYGRRFTIQDRRMVCADCGNVSYRGSQISQHELAVAAAVRELEGLLSAEDLSAIRLKYKLRQTDMEQILSTGPKTWTRWERGKVPQSKVADKYIRALADDPYLMRREMLAAGVENADAEAVFAQIEVDDRRRAHATLRAELSRRADVGREGIAAIAADAAFDAVLHGPRSARAVAA